MNDQEKEIEDIRSNDITPAMMAEAKKPKKTWFFERMGDGMIFPAEAREAWDICYNKSNWKRHDFKLLGTSDGKTYMRIVEESMGRAKVLEPEIAKKKEELSKYMRAEEKLIMDEAVDMEGDPTDKENEANKAKVLRLRGIMERLHDELDKLEEEFKNISSDIVKRATDAELEVAKKNQQARIDAGQDLDWPDQDENIITPNTDPKGRGKILGLMTGRRN